MLSRIELHRALVVFRPHVDVKSVPQELGADNRCTQQFDRIEGVLSAVQTPESLRHPVCRVFVGSKPVASESSISVSSLGRFVRDSKGETRILM